MGRTGIIRGFAWVDLAVTLPFAIPFVADWAIVLIYRLDTALGFGSTLPGFDSLHLMFVNVMGALGVVWAAARLGTPTEALARLDALGRVFVAALILHAITWGASPLLWTFIAIELAGAAAQLRRPNPVSESRDSSA